jgi:NADH dehydrogenase
MGDLSKLKTRIVVVGGGFGGLYTASALDKLTREDPTVEVTLISRDNFLLVTPLLFEAGSGVLDPRHVVSPCRALLKKARFCEANVTEIDIANRVVKAAHRSGIRNYEFQYDQLVIAVGGITNRSIIPGSDLAMAFKTVADAVLLRNHVLDMFEQADIETDPERKQRLLTFVIIGTGLVGVELAGELNDFMHNLTATYKNISMQDIKLVMYEATPSFLRELPQDLAAYAREKLAKRGVAIYLEAPVNQIRTDGVVLKTGEYVPAQTVVLCAGVAPNPLLATIQLEKNRGRIVVDATMRVKDHPEVWALGDCAVIPDPEGKPYPQLAQHALREARLLARNIVGSLKGQTPLPFVYKNKGTLAALGRYSAIGRVLVFKIRGFPAWFVWRGYYLLQMPKWSRRIRIMIDWALAVVFKNDVAQMDWITDEQLETIGTQGTKNAEQSRSAHTQTETNAKTPATVG